MVNIVFVADRDTSNQIKDDALPHVELRDMAAVAFKICRPWLPTDTTSHAAAAQTPSSTHTLLQSNLFAFDSS